MNAWDHFELVQQVPQIWTFKTAAFLKYTRFLLIFWLYSFLLRCLWSLSMIWVFVVFTMIINFVIIHSFICAIFVCLYSYLNYVVWTSDMEWDPTVLCQMSTLREESSPIHHQYKDDVVYLFIRVVLCLRYHSYHVFKDKCYMCIICSTMV